MLKCGIIGLPLSGKSTVFNVITRAGAEVKPYASGKTEPNKALVNVPDERFDKLVEIFKPKSEKPADVEFVDLAGLSKDAGKGAGLGNSFLSFVSESDALLHVVRVFRNDSVPHPENNIDPLRDYHIVEAELIYRDLGVITNRLSRLEEKKAKKKLTPQEITELELIRELEAHMLDEKPLREYPLDDEQKRMLSGYAFLTLKPELVVLNLDDTQAGNVPEISPLMSELESKNMKAVRVYGATEMELEQLDEDDRIEFMKDLSITEPGRERLIHEAYKLLGLISFFTSGADEVRAWTLKAGSTAVDAAGTIHSDLARGFIRAQVVSYDDFIANNASIAQCREKGVLRLEGKEYIVKDGDMIEIRFNV